MRAECHFSFDFSFDTTVSHLFSFTSSLEVGVFDKRDDTRQRQRPRGRETRDRQTHLSLVSLSPSVYRSASICLSLGLSLSLSPGSLCLNISFSLARSLSLYVSSVYISFCHTHSKHAHKHTHKTTSTLNVSVRLFFFLYDDHSWNSSMNCPPAAKLWKTGVCVSVCCVCVIDMFNFFFVSWLNCAGPVGETFDVSQTCLNFKECFQTKLNCECKVCVGDLF